MASQPPTIPSPLPAPGPGSPLHLVEPPPKAKRTGKKAPEPAPAPAPTPRRAIVDIAVARRVVETGIPVLAKAMSAGLLDDKTRAHYLALKKLNGECADAEFDDALPTRPTGRELVGSRATQPEEPLP